MSDELIEGRSLRRKTLEPIPEESSPSPRRRGRAKPRADDEPSGPYVSLEPPPEAGDVILDQAGQSTLHGGMEPVMIDAAAKSPRGTGAGNAAQAAASAPEDESTSPAPDLPWEVIDTLPDQAAAAPGSRAPEPTLQPIMRLPRVEGPHAPRAPEPTASPKESDKQKDADFIPLFHTPTGKQPPVTKEPSEFIPQFHTPTGEMLPVKDEELPGDAPTIQRGAGRQPAARDEPLERHTPPLMRPVESQDDEIAELYRRPRDKPPVRQRSRLDEPSGEVVEAEWVREVGGRADINDRIEARLREKQQQRRGAVSRPGNRRTILLVSAFVLIIAAAVLIRLWPVLFGAGSLVPTAPPAPTGTPFDITPTVSLGGGAAATAGPSTQSTAASADYQQGRLAFSSNRDGNYEIYVMDMKGGGTTRLTNRPAADRSPAWSPDGKQIVFVSDAGQNDDLWLIPASGGSTVQLTTDPGSDRNPAWSPDGTRIIFSRENVEGSRLMSLPTACLDQPETCEGLVTLLTPGGYDRFPAWSPDGKKIAFSASDLPGGSSVVALLNPDGSGYGALAGTGTSDFDPVWSPDGTRLAFVSYARGDYDVWIMTPDTQPPLQITQNQSTDTSPTWSPDGQWLAFASDRGAQANFHLFVIQANCAPGTKCEDNLIQLTSDPHVDDLDPAWAK